MSIAQFNDIYKRTEQLLSGKRKTPKDNIIGPKEKLAIGLECVIYKTIHRITVSKFVVLCRYLASGSMYRHIASTYRIIKQAFGGIIDEVCDALCVALKEEMPPLSNKDWIRIGNEFHLKWNFPNCLGAVDGKHIRIKCPKNARSPFFNYKVQFVYSTSFNVEIIFNNRDSIVLW